MEAAGSTVLWRLFRDGAAKDRSHAIVLPGGPPFTLAFFANDEMDRVENYDTMELAIFRADEIKRSLMADDWKEHS
jgi:hypothetical protein